MIWVQSGISFLFWIAYGIMQTRRSAEVRAWTLKISPTRRGLLAAALMLGSIVPVFIVLIVSLRYHGFHDNGMAPIVWLAVTVFGLLFVHGQTLATALLVTSAHESVTAGRAQASSTLNSSENDDHEVPSP